jgi:hypothetical protein
MEGAVMERAMTITEAAELGYGKKDKLYQAAREKRLRLRKNGRLTIITPDAWRAYVETLPEFKSAVSQ